MKPKVYFSKTITPEKVLELYDLLGAELPGKVAVKVQEPLLLSMNDAQLVLFSMI